jgi:type II secretory pathway pseudopilin PulG
LIELTVVLVILGFLATMVTLSFHNTHHRATRENVVDQLRHMDALCRAFAYEQDQQVDLLIDLDGNHIERQDTDGNVLGQPWTIPRPWQIDRLIVHDGDSKSGRVPIRYSRQGYCPTYALRLRRRNAATEEEWLIVIGATGVLLERKGGRRAKEIRNLLNAETYGDNTS